MVDNPGILRRLVPEQTPPADYEVLPVVYAKQERKRLRSGFFVSTILVTFLWEGVSQLWSLPCWWEPFCFTLPWVAEFAVKLVVVLAVLSVLLYLWTRITAHKGLYDAAIAEHRKHMKEAHPPVDIQFRESSSLHPPFYYVYLEMLDAPSGTYMAMGRAVNEKVEKPWRVSWGLLGESTWTVVQGMDAVLNIAQVQWIDDGGMRLALIREGSTEIGGTTHYKYHLTRTLDDDEVEIWLRVTGDALKGAYYDIDIRIWNDLTEGPQCSVEYSFYPWSPTKRSIPDTREPQTHTTS